MTATKRSAFRSRAIGISGAAAD